MAKQTAVDNNELAREIVVGHDVRHGSHTSFYRYREGIHLEVAIRIYTELISQAARANQLQEQLASMRAKQAFAYADLFVRELDARDAST